MVTLQVSVTPKSAHCASPSQEQPNPGIHTRSPSHGAKDGIFELHSQRRVVLLQLSALRKQSEEFKHEQGGCPTSTVMLMHILPGSHGANVGALVLHSHVGGIVVLLQESEVSAQSNTSKQEHPGWPGFSVTFTQILPSIHGANDGSLKLHSQDGGAAVMLQVSEVSEQCAVSKQEHAGCPGCSVRFKQIRSGSHGASVGSFAVHSHAGGLLVTLQLSALSKQLASIRHEHGGCPGFSVTFRHILSPSHGANVGILELHSHIAGIAVSLQVSELSKHCDEFKHEQGGCPISSVILIHIRPSSHGSKLGSLKEHSHMGGANVLLHESALSKQWSGRKQEQAGCSGWSVLFKQIRPSSHAAMDGSLKLH